MTIKLQCNCGSKYAFDVEPENNRMPFPVQCPSCGADGTEAANKIIAEAAAASTPSSPKLRVSMAKAASPEAPPVAPVPQTGEVFCNRHLTNPAASFCVVCSKPICLECMSIFGYLCSINCRYQAEQRGIVVPKYQFQKQAVEGREFRKATWITTLVVIVLLLVFGVWIWLGGIGSQPGLKYALKLNEAEQVQFFGNGKMLRLNSKHVAMHDLNAKKDLWSTSLTASEEFSSPPEYFIDKSDIWICQQHRVVCVNADTGEITKKIPIVGELISFTPGQSSLLVVSSTADTSRVVQRISLPSGDVSLREITVPRSEKHLLPDELPANVAPTAGVLLRQMELDEKEHRSINKVSSEFFSAGENLVELRTTLIEAKVVSVQTMKPKGPSHINGNLSASSNAGEIVEELSNDIKRSQTGGNRLVDESHYEVRLRRWIGEPQPVEWKADISGIPRFYSLSTVDLLVAGQILYVFDKSNNKLFESKLSNPLGELFAGEYADHKLVPAIQTANALYFFDQAIMTAFDLPSGNVRWRLTSIGIGRAQLDPAGALYIDSTSATPEDIKYPDQIKLDRIAPVILKVDSTTGKILWQTARHGHQCFLSGKFLYATSEDMGGIGMANALGLALGSPNNNSTTFHVYRLDPDTGKVIWDYQPASSPSSVSFQKNQFLLNDSSEVQLVKFLSF